MTDGATRRWDGMTPEEREAYVNQDVVKAGWREFPASGFLEDLESGETLADVIRPDIHVEADSAVFARLDPMQAECLRQRYVERRRLRDIAASIETRWVNEITGCVICRKTYTPQAVEAQIRRGREALAKLYGRG